MSETKNVEQKASGAPVDYSRPVGWWCPVCTRVSTGDYLLGAIRVNRSCLSTPDARSRRLHMIPVFLPLPTPEPVEVDEVETGEAEVVTMFSFATWWYACPDGSFARWVDGIEIHNNAEHHINVIAYESANARKKRGMK